MTGVQGTPTLTIAAAQNTAPVYEFRCLYSHDLRKKKKLWHDGSLRYHTFNKRVMVYDDSKNYIGDSHWREAEELQEGTELKLDKGVLVDVCDRIGETQTDLAPLLEKRRPENDSSPPRPPLRPISRAATSRTAPGNPQARPKSLSDVLGISQGPIGRARLPPQSPYEQLHHPPGRKARCEEPPAKKPRIEFDKENVELHGDKIHRRDPPLKANIVASIGRFGTSGTSGLQGGRAMTARQVINIPSEDEPALLTPSLPRATSREKASARKAFNSGDNHQQVPKISMPPPRERTSSIPAARSEATLQKLAASKTLPVMRGTSFLRPPTKPLLSTGSSKSKLRFALHKPRKKLLYEELLRSSHKTESRLQSRTSPIASRRTPSQERQSSRTRDCRPGQVSTFSNIESDCKDDNIVVGKAGTSKQPNGKMQDIDRDLAELFAQSSSPLFMPESPAQVQIGAPESQSPDSFPSLPLGDVSILPAMNCPTAPHGGNGPTAPDAPTPVVNGASQPVPLSKPTILDQQLMMPPPNLVALPSEPQQTSPQPRSLRRVVSENDSPGYARNQGFAASAVPGSHTVEAAMGPKLLGLRPFQSPAKLTKSLSDTAAKSRVRQTPTARYAEAESAEECGPWSKAEAYLLFDWFPPGREKLVFDNGEQNSMRLKVVKRGLLSDQLDAL